MSRYKTVKVFDHETQIRILAKRLREKAETLREHTDAGQSFEADDLERIAEKLLGKGAK